MYRHAHCLLICFLLFFWGVGCGLPEDPTKIALPEWQPEIAVPLINTDIQLEEVLDQFDSLTYLEIDQEGLLSVVYEADLFEVPPLSIITLPTIPVPMFDSTISIAAPFDQLQRIQLSGGRLEYEWEGTHFGQTEVEITVFNAIKDGEVFRQTVEFISPGLASGELDLSGYELIFTDGTLDMKYRATSLQDGQDHRLNRTVLTFNRLTYSYVEGYLGEYDFDLAVDSLSVNVATGWDDIDFQITDPRVSFLIENSYGIPLEITAEKLGVVREDGSFLSVASDELADGLILNYPSLAEVGEKRSTEVALNKNNSSLPEAIYPLPEALVYQLSGEAHPNRDSTKIGFITDSSAFSVGVALEIPLEFRLAPYIYSDTFALDVNVTDVLESGGAVLLTENGFPFEFGIQVYFLDEGDVALDSLFTGISSLLTAAPVDELGRVISIATERQDVSLDAETLTALLDAKKIAIKASISTSEEGSVPVRIYRDYGLGLKLGLSSKVNVYK